MLPRWRKLSVSGPELWTAYSAGELDKRPVCKCLLDKRDSGPKEDYDIEFQFCKMNVSVLYTIEVKND